MITQKHPETTSKRFLKKKGTNLQVKCEEDLQDTRPNAEIGNRKIALPLQSEIVFVSIKDILGFEADRNYTTIHLNNGKKYTVCQTLKSYEQKLTQFLFIRLNRTWMVNMKLIHRYCKREKRVFMENGQSICVSQNRGIQFLESVKNEFFLWS